MSLQERFLELVKECRDKTEGNTSKFYQCLEEACDKDKTFQHECFDLLADFKEKTTELLGKTASESDFCKYCKRKLLEEPYNLEEQCHISCKSEMEEYALHPHYYRILTSIFADDLPNEDLEKIFNTQTFIAIDTEEQRPLLEFLYRIWSILSIYPDEALQLLKRTATIAAIMFEVPPQNPYPLVFRTTGLGVLHANYEQIQSSQTGYIRANVLGFDYSEIAIKFRALDSKSFTIYVFEYREDLSFFIKKILFDFFNNDIHALISPNAVLGKPEYEKYLKLLPNDITVRAKNLRDYTMSSNNTSEMANVPDDIILMLNEQTNTLTRMLGIIDYYTSAAQKRAVIAHNLEVYYTQKLRENPLEYLSQKAGISKREMVHTLWESWYFDIESFYNNEISISALENDIDISKLSEIVHRQFISHGEMYSLADAEFNVDDRPSNITFLIEVR